MSDIFLIDAAELRAEVQAGAVLLDTRGAQAYWEGHLADALRLDADQVALPATTEAAVARLQALLAWALPTLGLETGSRVVVYGAANEPVVHRVAWALRYAGIAQTAVLDGGLAALGGDAALSSEAAPRTAIAPRLRFRPELLATAQQILEQVRAPSTSWQLLDSRDLAHYQGGGPAPLRAGHIPGARHWDVRQELQEDGRLAPADVLRERFASLGLDPARPVVTYCGSGPRASRTLTALSLAGFKDVRLYPASWSEWGAQGDWPAALPTTATV